MGSPKTTTKSHTETEPWKPAQGNLQKILGDASTLSQDSSNFKQQYSDTYLSSLDDYENLAGQETQAKQYLQPLVEGAGGNLQLGQDHLRGIATGDPGSNPFLEDLISRSREGTSNAVNSQFTAAGRYGSGAHTGSLTKALGDQEIGLRYTDYNNQQGRQDQAANVLFNQGVSGSQLGGQLDAIDAGQIGLKQQVGTQRNAILNDENLADVRANEWLAAQTVPIAGLGGTSDSTSISRTSSNPFGMLMGGLSMAGGLMGGGAPMGMMGGMMGGGGGGMMAPPPMMAPYAPMPYRPPSWGTGVPWT